MVALEAIGHAGHAVIALAFLVKDILRLRLMAIGASIGIITFNFGRPRGPVWPVIGWHSLFAAINAVHSAVLIYERRLLPPSPEEEALYRTVFQSLNRGQFRRLIRSGGWGTAASADVLAGAGTRFVAWRQQDLTRLLAGHRDLRAVFNAAIGTDLAGKLASRPT